MRLVELRPRWVGLHNWSSPSIYHVGLSFDSPWNRARRLAVLFTPAIDPEGLAKRHGWDEAAFFADQLKWARVGDTFETLTLAPSLNFMPHDWHGSITGGEVTTTAHP
jgi:hypothetical protein